MIIPAGFVPKGVKSAGFSLRVQSAGESAGRSEGEGAECLHELDALVHGGIGYGGVAQAAADLGEVLDIVLFEEGGNPGVELPYH